MLNPFYREIYYGNVSTVVVHSVTVGPEYGVEVWDGRVPAVEASVSDRQHWSVFFDKPANFASFLQQETIEVESENVFKLAAFALQVRKSLSQPLLAVDP